ncbi:hypothetical protein [Streptomyces sparsogenes]|uniref:hypothetical protein n=1 Tax=Streptomyces sparsogenes TaxID=67365 RepID=UPI0033FC22D4
MHIGRSFAGGGHIEALCPCPLAPCGLVDTENVDPECDQHPPTRCKTIRTGHAAEDCPEYGAAVVVAVGRTETARQRIIDVACLEPEGFVNASILGAIDDYRAAVAHELAERIRCSERLRSYTDGHMGDMNEAADFIDPEVP